jgi:hypothetical protein
MALDFACRMTGKASVVSDSCGACKQLFRILMWNSLLGKYWTLETSFISFILDSQLSVIKCEYCFIHICKKRSELNEG